MKIQILSIAFLILYFPVFSQTRIDSNVSVNIPGKLQRMDTDTTNASLSSFYSNSKTESYVVMRMAVVSNGEEVNTLPKDSNGLSRIYSQIINGQIRGMERKRFLLLDTQKVKIKGYSAYKITYSTKDSQNEGAETILLCLNGIVYVFTYSKVGDYITQHKDEFQQSIKINSLVKQISQVEAGSTGVFSVPSIVSYGILSLVTLVFFYIKSRQKSKLGINLKRVYCPVCQAKQPFIRIPANESQTLWGGHTCSYCSTEMDKYGEAINPKND
jgi:hypothetical protein